MIPFAAYTVAETPDAFHLAEKPQKGRTNPKSAPSMDGVEGSLPLINTWFLGPIESASTPPQTAL